MVVETGEAAIYRPITLGLALAFLVVPPVTAQDYQKGVAAYHRGDYATALRTWRPLALRGVASAQYNLGLIHAKGRGVPQDNTKAVKWYRRAAEQGLASAQNNLGFMYEKGRGVPQDYAKAVKWLRMAANQGDADAQFNLGAMYFLGRGVAKDHVAAEIWYRKAAVLGHANARYHLNFMHRKVRSALRKAAPATARGDFGVQLGSVRSKARAVKEAERLIGLHEATLGSLAIVPVRADLGSLGVYYRLRVGPFPDREKAASLCRKLSARQQICIVVKL